MTAKLTGVNVVVKPEEYEFGSVVLPLDIGSTITGDTTLGLVPVVVTVPVLFVLEFDLEQPTLITPRAIIEMISNVVFIKPSF
jgi:hypothetical protein